MVTIRNTKIYKNNQITIPSKIRKELNINEKSSVDWILNNDKTITLKIENKKKSVKDLIGLGSSEEVTNAVNLKRGLYF
ncbi:AbrB/MazE/SpoVT family DNA-binding domain-containing protein [uncultured Methanobrevibacter sp.]|uniref:AbrB/MazE/SpoVT family DNA-binding domain-containing protein n=1 Tax=uncultured Methanobrevibacter sp. TaxID=253161 RepID=UPI0025DB8A74|nr:AbrB/MazE/SpoVT family DNA-binding domain-containing protein [uncultured Methanobrevibacter sp.]